MTEIQIGPGDSVSRLLQLYAKEIGLKRVWAGNAQADCRGVVVDLYNAKLLKDALWSGLQELYAMPQLKDLPEPVQVKMMAVVLSAKAIAELDTRQ
jgi:hypothetical protein